MNCASCKKPVPAGKEKCPACGAAVKQEYSYDLLPDEPPKKKEEEGPSFALPPGVELPPAPPLPGTGDAEKPARVLRADRPRGANAAAGGGTSLFKLGVGAGALLILIILGTRMCGGPSVKITGAGKVEMSFSTSNIMTTARPFEILGGKAEYTMTVTAKNGDVKAGVVQRGARDKITPEVVKTWNLQPVAKGETKTFEGELDSGQYSWVVATDSKVLIQGSLKAKVE